MISLGNRRRGGDLGLLFLFLEVARVGVDHIPPVTLATLAINVAIHLLSPLNWDIHDVCISGAFVLYDHQFLRMILSPFYHLNDFHLYYNMTSLLWKGRRLERVVGSWILGCMIAIFAIGSNLLMVAVSYVMMKCLDATDPFYTCSAGFSGVLFALKVVVHDLAPYSYGYVLGIPVDIKYLAWAELGLIYIMVPNSSFLGHLCGIAMGYAYKYGYLNPVFKMLDAARNSHNGYEIPARYQFGSSSTGFRASNNNNPLTPSNSTNNTNNRSNSTYTNNSNSINMNNNINNNANNINNNTNITNNNTNTNANINTNENNNEEQYHNEAQNNEAFRKRYENYNYQKGPPKKQAPATSAGSGSSRDVVNGWLEK